MNNLIWREACGGSGTCVQTAAWRTACAASNGCVEACCTANGVALIRDSVDPDGPRIAMPAAAWRNLLTTLKELP